LWWLELLWPLPAWPVLGILRTSVNWCVLASYSSVSAWKRLIRSSIHSLPAFSGTIFPYATVFIAFLGSKGTNFPYSTGNHWLPATLSDLREISSLNYLKSGIYSDLGELFSLIISCLFGFCLSCSLIVSMVL